MIAYRLRQRVTLQQPTTPSTGETGSTYTNTATMRAEVIPLRGGESSRRDQMEATVTWRVAIRHRSTIGVDYRFVWGSKTLNIVSVYDPDQLGHVLLCECVEVAT
jgi:SPP1 family predicted phage head-tail adaptor